MKPEAWMCTICSCMASALASASNCSLTTQMFGMDGMSANAGLGPDLFVPRAFLAILMGVLQWKEKLVVISLPSFGQWYGIICGEDLPLPFENYTISAAVPQTAGGLILHVTLPVVQCCRRGETELPQAAFASVGYIKVIDIIPLLC